MDMKSESSALYLVLIIFPIVYSCLGITYLVLTWVSKFEERVSWLYRAVKQTIGCANIILTCLKCLELLLGLPCYAHVLHEYCVVTFLGIPHIIRCFEYSKHVNFRIRRRPKKIRRFYLFCIILSLANFLVFLLAFALENSYQQHCRMSFDAIYIGLVDVFIVSVIYWLARGIPWKFDAFNVSKELRLFCIVWTVTEVLAISGSVLNLQRGWIAVTLQIATIISYAALFSITFAIPFHEKKALHVKHIKHGLSIDHFQTTFAAPTSKFSDKTSRDSFSGRFLGSNSPLIKFSLKPRSTQGIKETSPSSKRVFFPKRKSKAGKLMDNRWSNSTLFKVVCNEEMLEIVLKYSRSNFFPELVLFPKAVADYFHFLSTTACDQTVHAKFVEVYQTYIEVDSPYEINISSKMRSDLEVFLDFSNFRNLSQEERQLLFFRVFQ